jgi:hypothetical protein
MAAPSKKPATASPPPQECTNRFSLIHRLRTESANTIGTPTLNEVLHFLQQLKV